jgi:hypothetical protein
MDSSKGAIADNRHRALTHNAWFISNVIEKVFGHFIVVTMPSGKSKKVSTREVAEQHVLEDFGGRFIPSAQDFLAKIPMEPWMNNGIGVPPSYEAIELARAAVERRKQNAEKAESATAVSNDVGQHQEAEGASANRS